MYEITRNKIGWCVDIYKSNNLINSYNFISNSNDKKMDMLKKEKVILTSAAVAHVNSYFRGKALVDIPWKPNLFLNRKEQVRRAERHWEGISDLSAEGMIYYTNEGIVLIVKVKDDNVKFSGGKFYYDNDSIQVYFHRKDEKYSDIPTSTNGVYGLIVVPGVFGNASTIKTVGTNIKNLDNIGVSTCETDHGYEILLDIPWELIGGMPDKGDLWGFDIIINDRDSGIRRDLQMVWSGCAEDERIYLMQQFHNKARFGTLDFSEI